MPVFSYHQYHKQNSKPGWKPADVPSDVTIPFLLNLEMGLVIACTFGFLKLSK
jgi:hypothetical protein